MYADVTPEIKEALTRFKELLDRNNGNLDEATMNQGVELIRKVLNNEAQRIARREESNKMWELYPDTMGS